MLCQEWDERFLILHKRGRNTRYLWPKLRPLRRSLISKQAVEQIICQNADRHAINWLQRNALQ